MDGFGVSDLILQRQLRPWSCNRENGDDFKWGVDAFLVRHRFGGEGPLYVSSTWFLASFFLPLKVGRTE
jgi:hypothetical protein